MARTGWAWLVSYEIMPELVMFGWLWVRPLLVSDMQAFAEKVSDYNERFKFEATSCQDRIGVSVHGTTCVELLPFCHKDGFNWRDPDETNAQACPSTCGKCPPDLIVTPDSVDLAYSVALFDAIMLYAHGATKMMSEGGSLRNGLAVTAALRNTSFTGVGGTTIALDNHGDRIESYEVLNYVLEAGDVMRSVAVGVYDCEVRQYRAYERVVLWPGNTTNTPADYFSGAPSCTLCAACSDRMHAMSRHRSSLGTPCITLCVVRFEIND